MLKINPIRTPCDRCAPSTPYLPRDVRYPFALSVQIRHFRVVTPTRAGRLCSILCPGLNHSRARPSDPHQKLRGAVTGARPISNSPTRSALANAARAAASILSGRMQEHAMAGVDALNAAPARAVPIARDSDTIIIPGGYARTAERSMA